MAGQLRIDHTITSGHFNLDGETFDVDNNVWVLGDDDECVVIDAPHDVDAITTLVADRRLSAVICTHAHDDHVKVAPALSEATAAPILLHPHDRPVWELTHPWREPDGDLADGQHISVGDGALRVIHTPGHAPGAVCLYVEDLDVLFSGDTLFQGGPGATGRSFSDFATILASIRGKLFALPDRTRVLPGHGEETTIGAERPSYDEWVARGH